MDKRAFFSVIREGFATWLERLGYSPSAIYGYGRYIAHFFTWLEAKGFELESLTTSQMDTYRAYLEARPNRRKNGGGLSQATIREHLQVLRTLAVYLQHGHGVTVPVPDLAKVPLKGYIKQSFAILTPGEVQQLFEAAGNTPRGLMDRVILCLYYGCGLRRNEGLHLTPDDIDWKRRYMHVRVGKGGKERVIPFGEAVYSDLKAYCSFTNAATDKPLLPVCGATVLDRLKKLSAMAGITTPVTVHGLRHSIATHLLRGGMQLEHIRIFLGHSSLESTQIYTRLAEEDEQV
jgi:integrase/recombinase XerD